MYFNNLNKSFLRGFSSPLSMFQQKRKRREDVVWHIIYIFYCSPKGDKPKDHQNSASMYGTNHCRLEHVHAEAFSTCRSQKSRSNSRHLTSFHNLQGISQNIRINREKKKPQLLSAAKEKQGLKLSCVFLPCSQFRHQEVEPSMKWAVVKLLAKNTQEQQVGSRKHNSQQEI